MLSSHAFLGLADQIKELFIARPLKRVLVITGVLKARRIRTTFGEPNSNKK